MHCSTSASHLSTLSHPSFLDARVLNEPTSTLLFVPMLRLPRVSQPPHLAHAGQEKRLEPQRESEDKSPIEKAESTQGADRKWHNRST
eukprot:scaffold32608_cov54-Phaeocystis_antarctica.AAC.1